jgi:hypothetical protein
MLLQLMRDVYDTVSKRNDAFVLPGIVAPSPSAGPRRDQRVYKIAQKFLLIHPLLKTYTVSCIIFLGTAYTYTPNEPGA